METASYAFCESNPMRQLAFNLSEVLYGVSADIDLSGGTILLLLRLRFIPLREVQEVTCHDCRTTSPTGVE